jgi:CRISPR/Cas system endoribonuclease Cas6 (RAMP superfamily)
MYNKIRKDVDNYSKTYLSKRDKLSLDFYTLVKELAINQSNNLCYGRTPNIAMLNEINFASKLGKILKELDEIAMYQNKILVI